MNVGNIGNKISTYLNMRNIYIYLNIVRIYIIIKIALNTISDVKSLISMQIMKKSMINEYSDMSRLL